MNLEEAQKVADIIATADGQCGSCADTLCFDMNEAFPQYSFVMAENWYAPKEDGGGKITVALLSNEPSDLPQKHLD